MNNEENATKVDGRCTKIIELPYHPDVDSTYVSKRAERTKYPDKIFNDERNLLQLYELYFIKKVPKRNIIAYFDSNDRNITYAVNRLRKMIKDQFGQ